MSFTQKRFFSPGFLFGQLFVFTLLTTLYYGWSQRDSNYISAENGTGYILGITGGSMMLLLLLYPLSKRSRLLSRLIPVRYWFRLHMLLGILGPLLILYHANFHLGSTNSNIAMFSMLLVAGSGVIGRYIYTHIHHGLYGARITLQELNADTESSHKQLLASHITDEKINQLLKKMEDRALQPGNGLLPSILLVMHLAVSSRRIMRLLARCLKDKTSQERRNIRVAVKRYTLALRRTAAFIVYERLFSLWHILHLPLFIMMIITAVIHIVAVHMY